MPANKAGLEKLVRWAVAQGFERSGKGNLKLPVLGETVVKANGDISVVISTNDIDRHGDILEPKGIDIKAFKKNPVVMWAHDYSQLPIARAPKITVDKGSIQADLEWWKGSAFAVEVSEMYRQGFLSAWSVGFLPTKWDEITDEKSGEITGYHIKKWELLEFSAVPIPANPNALGRAFDSGLITVPSLVKSLGLSKKARYKPLEKLGELTVSVEEPLVKEEIPSEREKSGEEMPKPAEGDKDVGGEDIVEAQDENDAREPTIAPENEETEGPATVEKMEKAKASRPEGSWAFCVCKECGYWEEHTAGTPCADKTCPDCGKELTPSDEKPEKAVAEAEKEQVVEDEVEQEDRVALLKHLVTDLQEELVTVKEGRVLSKATKTKLQAAVEAIRKIQEAGDEATVALEELLDLTETSRSVTEEDVPESEPEPEPEPKETGRQGKDEGPSQTANFDNLVRTLTGRVNGALKERLHYEISGAAATAIDRRTGRVT